MLLYPLHQKYHNELANKNLWRFSLKRCWFRPDFAPLISQSRAHFVKHTEGSRRHVIVDEGRELASRWKVVAELLPIVQWCAQVSRSPKAILAAGLGFECEDDVRADEINFGDGLWKFKTLAEGVFL